MKEIPVLVSVYNRLFQLKQCVESLKRNSLSRDVTLFIVSDAAASSKDVKAVQEVRSFIASIEGFKDVVLLANERNKGGFRSVYDARNEIFKRYEALIFLEDDIVVSPYFLDYMIVCMKKYAGNDKVFAVSGYNHMFKIPKTYPYDVYFAASYPAWGIGIWKNRNTLFEEEVTARFEDFIQDNHHLLPAFKKYAYESYRILMNDIEKGRVAGDVRRAFYQFCKGMVTVMPVRSLTKSIGHDGSGEHCPFDSVLQNQVIDKEKRNYRLPEDVIIEPDIMRRRRWYFSPISKKIKVIKRLYRNSFINLY